MFVIIVGLSTVPLVAANFWDSKPFSDWSPSEVAKMLTSSPWARRFSILTPDFSLARRVGGLTGGVVGNGGRSGRAPGGPDAWAPAHHGEGHHRCRRRGAL
jgi:hypothetical protein